jgi:hypothetical protein
MPGANSGELFAKQIFTVIAVWDSTSELRVDHILATDAGAAMREAAANQTDRTELQIVCAIPGEHAATAPCEDSGKTAQASDLADDGPYEFCECGRRPNECATADGGETHADR